MDVGTTTYGALEKAPFALVFHPSGPSSENKLPNAMEGNGCALFYFSSNRERDVVKLPAVRR